MRPPNEIVYKYRSWTNPFHRDLLYHNELYLASPKDFNDPFDCYITPDFDLLDTDKKILQFASNNGIIDRLKVISNDPAFIRKQIIEHFKKNRKELEEFHRNEFRELASKHWGIYSTSTNYKSILMWSHYSSNHTGFCVGLDIKKILINHPKLIHGFVKYEKDFTSIDPLNNDFYSTNYNSIFTKEESWRYESEFRLFLLSKEEFDNSSRKIHVTDDCFNSIYIGMHFQESDVSKIKTIAENKGIPVYRMEPISKRFELKEVLI